MKTVWTVLGALGFISGAAFLVFWLLAWTGLVPWETVAPTCGVMLLVTGLFTLREAANKSADRGKWARSNVKVGRLSAFAIGTFFCAISAAILGAPWLPNQFGIGFGAVAFASFVLGRFGATLDSRAHKRMNREKGLYKPLPQSRLNTDE